MYRDRAHDAFSCCTRPFFASIPPSMPYTWNVVLPSNETGIDITVCDTRAALWSSITWEYADQSPMTVKSASVGSAGSDTSKTVIFTPSSTGPHCPSTVSRPTPSTVSESYGCRYSENPGSLSSPSTLGSPEKSMTKNGSTCRNVTRYSVSP